jgi:small conductance mechanosensitive channel
MMEASPAAAAANATVAKAVPVVAEPSAAQKLLTGLGALWRNLANLEPGEVALNFGLSVLVVVAVAVAIWILRRLLHAGLDKLAAKGVVPQHEVGSVKQPPRIAKMSWLLVRTSLVLAAGLMVLSIWGLDLLGWLTTTGTGATLSRLVGVILVSVGLVEVAGHVVNRLLNALYKHTDRSRRAGQMKTLGPLVRGLIQGFIVVVASLTILSELGVQIGPLLASAGVVGIAVGFGAQTLVKDFLTGLFLIMEDIVAVGDSVRVGDRSGVVESMTLRTIRLRNFDGTLHILPYSEAQVISNETKGFSAYVIELGINYDTDFNLALSVMKRVGEDLQVDPVFGSLILQPLELLGVDRLGESTVILKARFKTLPGQQATVGREYNKRIKEAFDAEGIDLPSPTRVMIAELRNMTETAVEHKPDVDPQSPKG